MKTYDTTDPRPAFQGDLMIRRVDALPSGLAPRAPERGVHVVAHSETGHHHTLPGDVVFVPSDGMLAYAVVGEAGAELVHHRPTDTHETIRLPQGTYELRRQREYTPEGWRRVED